VTYDETAYLNLANNMVRGGSAELFTTWGVAPLPVLLSYTVPALLDTRPIEEEVFNGRIGDPEKVELARWIHLVVVGGSLIAVVTGWLFLRRGLFAAAIGGGFLITSPTILAHVSLATTDAMFATLGLITLAALSYYRSQPSVRRYLLILAAFGLSLSTKYSAIVLTPILAIGIVASRTYPKVQNRFVNVLRWALRCGLQVLVLLVTGFTICWAFHGFRFVRLKNSSFEKTLPDSPWKKLSADPNRAEQLSNLARKIQVPAPIRGFAVQSLMTSYQTRETYCMGNIYPKGTRLFYLVAIWCKSTPAELLLFSIGVIYLILMGFRMYSGASLDPAHIIWASTALFLFIICSLAKKQLGIRYVIIIYPLMFMLVIDWLSRVSAQLMIKLVLALLLAFQIFVSINTRPYYLSYFNCVVGGSDNGDQWLLVSDLDWGQDLPLLYNYVESIKPDNIIIAYYGSATPSSYNIHTLDWMAFDSCRHKTGIFVVSINRRTIRMHADDDNRPFSALAPDAKVGHSLLVYDLSRPEVRDALAEVVRKYPAERQKK
jgi:hypothetical protein